jgi:hypothetical protein
MSGNIAQYAAIEIIEGNSRNTTQFNLFLTDDSQEIIE